MFWNKKKQTEVKKETKREFREGREKNMDIFSMSYSS